MEGAIQPEVRNSSMRNVTKKSQSEAMAQTEPTESHNKQETHPFVFPLATRSSASPRSAKACRPVVVDLIMPMTTSSFSWGNCTVFVWSEKGESYRTGNTNAEKAGGRAVVVGIVVVSKRIGVFTVGGFV